MVEQWLPIAGYEGLYEVSDQGRVRRLQRMTRCKGGGARPMPERILNPSKHRYGHLVIGLYKDGKAKTHRLHTLVAVAFLDEPETEHSGILVTNHVNGDPTDNRASNLEWCTIAENVRHGWIRRRGGEGSAIKREPSYVRTIRALLAVGMKHKDIAALTGVSCDTVSCIKTGRRWKAAKPHKKGDFARQDG